MPKSEREESIATLTARIFSAMVNDLVMDATLQAHHQIARNRTICSVCNTRCGTVHASAPASASNSSLPQQVTTLSTSRQGSPASIVDVKVTNGSSGTGTNTPTSVKDGNLYLECVNCSRQIASNRYAPHLSTCMGLASARRSGTGRGSNKSMAPSEAGRSPSPPSDTGAISDSPKTKGKVKAASKRADEAEFKLKRKRLDSPSVSPVKNQKKQKTTASPVSKFKARSNTPASRNNSRQSPSGSQLKTPSKLRESSTASFMGGSSSSSSSRDSSPAVSAATPASSSFSHSPHLANRAIASKTKVNGTGPPKRPSPPRLPSIHVPDYSIDVEGEETGSSTDTDSS